MATSATFDPKDLEAKVKAMYRKVAEEPRREFHFEMGRAMAERLPISTVYRPSPSSPSPASATTSISPISKTVRLWSTSAAVPVWTPSSRA